MSEVGNGFFEYGSSFPVPKSDYNMYYMGLCVPCELAEK